MFVTTVDADPLPNDDIKHYRVKSQVLFDKSQYFSYAKFIGSIKKEG